MGWLFTSMSRFELIRTLLEPKDSAQATHRVIAHTLRGNVLWSVAEFTAKAGSDFTNLAPGASRRFICCDLLQRGSDGWGYKDMDESMSPFYYTCPLSYLEMAQEYSPDWREKVRTYHANRRKTVSPR